jgi:hypothetical protein
MSKKKEILHSEQGVNYAHQEFQKIVCELELSSINVT